MFHVKEKLNMSKTQMPIDKKLQDFGKLVKLNEGRSGMGKFYLEMGEKIAKGYPQLIEKYGLEISRIKKSQKYWNYTDIQIVRKSIKKSMHNETLSLLIVDWCSAMQLLILEPMLANSNNEFSKKLTLQQKIKQIQKELAIFCQFLFCLAFQMYQVFFRLHYQSVKKITDGKKWTKQEIYKRERRVFEDFILNVLTTSEEFKCLYHQYFMAILKSKHKANKQLSTQFHTFLQQQLSITHPYTQIYAKTSKKLWQFHNESSLQTKLQKITQIIPEIENDHLRYYKVHSLAPQARMETITTRLLSYLFELYCPQVPASMNYIHMMICYRQGEGGKGNKENFRELLDTYCFLWLSQDTPARFFVVLDCFQKGQDSIIQ